MYLFRTKEWISISPNAKHMVNIIMHLPTEKEMSDVAHEVVKGIT
jgi:hypothetical protein